MAAVNRREDCKAVSDESLINCRSNINKRKRVCQKHQYVTCFVMVFIFFTFNIIFILIGHQRHLNEMYLGEKPILGTHRDTSSPSLQNIFVEVQSSKDVVYVKTNGAVVYKSSYLDEFDDDRGIHIVILNQFTGAKMAAESFDTSENDDEFEHMSSFLSVQNGRIIIFAVKDEASKNLGQNIKNLIKRLGSRLISDLEWRDTWAFITKKGNWIAEDRQKSALKFGHPSPVVVTADIDLSRKDERCKWRDDRSSLLRRKFCEEYDGYESVCSCLNPVSINLTAPPLATNSISFLPIIIIAGNRPRFLYTMLRKLLTSPGVNRNLVTVYIDGYHKEPIAVLQLLNVRYVEHPKICQHKCSTSQHYKRSISETFDSYPNAEYALILEEVLGVTNDIIDYFNQLLPVFSSDDSLFCLSAWSDLSDRHSGNDSALLYRSEYMPANGWVIKRKIFKEELEHRWPQKYLNWDWRIWLNFKSNMKGRHCITPDVSRTYRLDGCKKDNGLDGYFKRKPLNNQGIVTFDLSKISQDGYDNQINELVKNAEVLDHTKDPCSDDFIPNTKKRTYVYYVKYPSKSKYETWFAVSECFSLWYLDARSQYKAMWRFWWRGNEIFVVGSTSPYAVHKPADVEPQSKARKRRRKKLMI